MKPSCCKVTFVLLIDLRQKFSFLFEEEIYEEIVGEWCHKVIYGVHNFCLCCLHTSIFPILFISFIQEEKSQNQAYICFKKLLNIGEDGC